MYVEFPNELMISNSGNGFSYEFHDIDLEIMYFKTASRLFYVLNMN